MLTRVSVNDDIGGNWRHSPGRKPTDGMARIAWQYPDLQVPGQSPHRGAYPTTNPPI